MKSMYQQEKELFVRHADIAGGYYISIEKVTQLLGRDAARYAVNAVKGYRNMAAHYNIYNDIPVLTFKGFSDAFHYFNMMEIKKGLHNAYETPDYLARPEFA